MKMMLVNSCEDIKQLASAVDILLEASAREGEGTVKRELKDVAAIILGKIRRTVQ
jgi:hypothetical protein